MLIAGMGDPRRYFLWSTFTIDTCQRQTGKKIHLEGPGWQLAPPQELKGPAFEQFRRQCAYFIGFRDITRLPFTRQLLSIAERHRPPGQLSSYLNALRDFHSTTPHKNIQKQIEKVIHAHGDKVIAELPELNIALSIRQPHVEAIFRGIKKIEYRSFPTSKRGRIMIYASRIPADNADALMTDYGIKGVKFDDLPRGVIVGSVELYHSEGGQWHLRHPIPARSFRQPTGRPQPVWFKPFP